MYNIYSILIRIEYILLKETPEESSERNIYSYVFRSDKN
nr:MAG TPA: hypothetical protein [Caudoviricetes sp.]